MYQTCPKCRYERSSQDNGDHGVCPACGLIYAKWLKQQYATSDQPRAANFIQDNEAGSRLGATLAESRQLIFHINPARDRLELHGRLLLLLGFAAWGIHFIFLDFETNAIGDSFMHTINLVFHEAGHVIFGIFGSHFLMTLGGTLGQLLMPLIVMLSLLIARRDPFGAAVGMWWLGQSFMDCAPYINDARSLQLILLGGGTGADKPGMHDWENILLDLDLIEYEHRIAAIFDALGSLLLILALLWAGYIVCREYRQAS